MISSLNKTSIPTKTKNSSLSSSFISNAFQNLSLTPNKGININTQRNRKSLLIESRSYEAGVGIFATKAAMTTYYTPEGRAWASTILAFEEGNIVAQVKTEETDGYNAVQVGYKIIPERKCTKPVIGHLKKHECPPMKKLREFKLKDGEKVKAFEPGTKLNIEEMFKVGDKVDVAGKTIGKGFQGAIKRWHHDRGPKTHGSKSYRQHGSIGGGSATPSRVFPGMKMAGRMGNVRRKIRKLEILELDVEGGYMLVKGSVPGKRGNVLEIAPAKIVGKNI